MFVKAAATAKHAGDDAKREAEARRRAAALEPKLVYLTIVVPEDSRVDGLVIKRNDTALDRALWDQRVPVDPDEYTISGEAPGREPWSTSVVVRARNKDKKVEVPVLDKRPEPPRTEARRVAAESSASRDAGDRDAAPPGEPSSFTGRRKLALVVAAVGVAAIGGSVGFGLHAGTVEDQAEPDLPRHRVQRSPRDRAQPHGPAQRDVRQHRVCRGRRSARHRRCPVVDRVAEASRDHRDRTNPGRRSRRRQLHEGVLMRRPVMTAIQLTAAVAALACVAACSIPEKLLIDAGAVIDASTIDAKPLPFACFGQPPATTANPQITISGSLIDPLNPTTPLSGAPIEVHTNNPDVLIKTVMTGADGSFSYTLETASMAQDLFLRIVPTGFIETRYYPAGPLTHDLRTDVYVFTGMTLATFASVAGIAIDPMKAIFVAIVTDCNGDAVGEAKVTTKPSGTILYLDGGRPSTTATATDKMTGTAYAVNLDAGSTMITATVGSMTLQRSPVDGVPGVIVQAEIHP